MVLYHDVCNTAVLVLSGGVQNTKEESGGKGLEWYVNSDSFIF